MGTYNPERHAWRAMIYRCHRPADPTYHNYGARGIQVCDEWRQSFDAFLSHIGRRPSPNHELDRINNNKGYEPGNVRWVTRSENLYNTRRTRMLSFNGETLPLGKWAKRMGVSREVLALRLDRYGWPLEKALTTRLQQGVSYRPTSRRQRTITFAGKTRTLREWAERINVPPKVLAARIDRYKWPLEVALSSPLSKGLALKDRS